MRQCQAGRIRCIASSKETKLHIAMPAQRNCSLSMATRSGQQAKATVLKRWRLK